MDYKWIGLEQKWIGSRKLDFLPTPKEKRWERERGIEETETKKRRKKITKGKNVVFKLKKTILN